VKPLSLNSFFKKGKRFSLSPKEGEGRKRLKRKRKLVLFHHISLVKKGDPATCKYLNEKGRGGTLKTKERTDAPAIIGGGFLVRKKG